MSETPVPAPATEVPSRLTASEANKLGKNAMGNMEAIREAQVETPDLAAAQAREVNRGTWDQVKDVITFKTYREKRMIDDDIMEAHKGDARVTKEVDGPPYMREIRGTLSRVEQYQQAIDDYDKALDGQDPAAVKQRNQEIRKWMKDKRKGKAVGPKPERIVQMSPAEMARMEAAADDAMDKMDKLAERGIEPSSDAADILAERDQWEAVASAHQIHILQELGGFQDLDRAEQMKVLEALTNPARTVQLASEKSVVLLERLKEYSISNSTGTNHAEKALTAYIKSEMNQLHGVEIPHTPDVELFSSENVQQQWQDALEASGIDPSDQQAVDRFQRAMGVTVTENGDGDEVYQMAENSPLRGLAMARDSEAAARTALTEALANGVDDPDFAMSALHAANVELQSQDMQEVFQMMIDSAAEAAIKGQGVTELLIERVGLEGKNLFYAIVEWLIQLLEGLRGTEEDRDALDKKIEQNSANLSKKTEGAQKFIQSIKVPKIELSMDFLFPGGEDDEALPQPVPAPAPADGGDPNAA